MAKTFLKPLNVPKEIAVTCEGNLLSFKGKLGEITLDIHPDVKILEVIKLEKGMNCLITKGVNAGKIGKIDEIKEGTFSIPKSIDIILDDRTVEIPARLVMPIGKDKPAVTIR